MGFGQKSPLFGDKCKKCGVTLTRENCVFNYHKLRSSCKSCHSEYQKNYRINNKEKHVAYDLKELYGISLEEYNKKVQLQLSGCAICKQPCASGQRLSVDHDHKTKQVRDLLCKRCNVIIGLCNEDDLLLSDIIEYLKRHDMKKAV